MTEFRTELSLSRLTRCPAVSKTGGIVQPTVKGNSLFGVMDQEM